MRGALHWGPRKAQIYSLGIQQTKRVRKTDIIARLCGSVIHTLAIKQFDFARLSTKY